jgi:hypothetical protein
MAARGRNARNLLSQVICKHIKLEIRLMLVPEWGIIDLKKRSSKRNIHARCGVLLDWDLRLNTNTKC